MADVIDFPTRYDAVIIARATDRAGETKTIGIVASEQAQRLFVNHVLAVLADHESRISALEHPLI